MVQFHNTMSSKRKVPSLGLERRVRPRREDKWEPEPESEDDHSDDHGPAEEGIGSPESNDDDDDDDEQDESAESDPEVYLQPTLSITHHPILMP